MRYMAFEGDDPDWELEQFDFDEDPYRMDAIRGILDATDPDLTRFRDAGGKMITYHGWSDPALNPLMAVNYYEDVLAETPEADDFYRLFMVPGMFHCAGGRGVNRVDAFSGPGEMGRDRRGARPAAGRARRPGRRGSDDPAGLPVSGGRALHRRRRRRRRRELRVPASGSVGRPLNGDGRGRQRSQWRNGWRGVILVTPSTIPWFPA